MHKKLNILFAMIIVLVSLVACSDKTVKYVSGDADVIEDEPSLEGDATEIDNGQYSIVTGTPTDGQCVEADWDVEPRVPVYVCGAVQSPGVYYMNDTALKAEALELAGGFAPDAATDYINLAETVVAGEKIYFPYIYELQDGYNMDLDEVGDGSSRQVNINTATKDELMTLPGIGESKAEAIIKYRDKNGPFQSIQDITKIPGIKEGVYNNIKDYIVVS